MIFKNEEDFSLTVELQSQKDKLDQVIPHIAIDMHASPFGDKEFNQISVILKKIALSFNISHFSSFYQTFNNNVHHQLTSTQHSVIERFVMHINQYRK